MLCMYMYVLRILCMHSELFGPWILHKTCRCFADSKQFPQDLEFLREQTIGTLMISMKFHQMTHFSLQKYVILLLFSRFSSQDQQSCSIAQPSPYAFYLS